MRNYRRDPGEVLQEILHSGEASASARLLLMADVPLAQNVFAWADQPLAEAPADPKGGKGRKSQTGRQGARGVHAGELRES